MDYLLMFFTILIFVFQTLSFKEFSRSFMKNTGSYFLFNTIYFGMVFLIFIILKEPGWSFNHNTLLLGVVFGVLFVATIFCYMSAMEHGPLSYSSLSFSFGLIIPVVFGLALWNEKMSLFQIAGLLLLLLTFYIGSGSSGDSGKKLNLKWFILIVLAFFGNGLLMSITKYHQVLLPGREVREFLVVSFGTAATLSFAAFLVYRLVFRHKISHLASGRFGLVALVAGITTAFGNQFILQLAGRLPGVLLFPVANGGVVMLSSIASVLFFKEKLDRRGVLGLVTGLAALALLSLN